MCIRRIFPCRAGTGTAVILTAWVSLYLRLCGRVDPWQGGFATIISSGFWATFAVVAVKLNFACALVMAGAVVVLEIRCREVGKW